MGPTPDVPGLFPDCLITAQTSGMYCGQWGTVVVQVRAGQKVGYKKETFARIRLKISWKLPTAVKKACV